MRRHIIGVLLTALMVLTLAGCSFWEIDFFVRGGPSNDWVSDTGYAMVGWSQLLALRNSLGMTQHSEAIWGLSDPTIGTIRVGSNYVELNPEEPGEAQIVAQYRGQIYTRRVIVYPMIDMETCPLDGFDFDGDNTWDVSLIDVSDPYVRHKIVFNYGATLYNEMTPGIWRGFAMAAVPKNVAAPAPSPTTLSDLGITAVPQMIIFGSSKGWKYVAFLMNGTRFAYRPLQ